MKNMQIGQVVYLGWNSAKYGVGDSDFAFDVPLRVEALGFDWVVFRCPDGKPYTASFNTPKEVTEFMSEVSEEATNQ